MNLSVRYSVVPILMLLKKQGTVSSNGSHHNAFFSPI